MPGFSLVRKSPVRLLSNLLTIFTTIIAYQNTAIAGGTFVKDKGQINSKTGVPIDVTGFRVPVRPLREDGDPIDLYNDVPGLKPEVERLIEFLNRRNQINGKNFLELPFVKPLENGKEIKKEVLVLKVDKLSCEENESSVQSHFEKEHEKQNLDFPNRAVACIYPSAILGEFMRIEKVVTVLELLDEQKPDDGQLDFFEMEPYYQALEIIHEYLHQLYNSEDHSYIYPLIYNLNLTYQNYLLQKSNFEARGETEALPQNVKNASIELYNLMTQAQGLEAKNVLVSPWGGIIAVGENPIARVEKVKITKPSKYKDRPKRERYRDSFETLAESEKFIPNDNIYVDLQSTLIWQWPKYDHYSEDGSSLHNNYLAVLSERAHGLETKPYESDSFRSYRPVTLKIFESLPQKVDQLKVIDSNIRLTINFDGKTNSFSDCSNTKFEKIRFDTVPRVKSDDNSIDFICSGKNSKIVDSRFFIDDCASKFEFFDNSTVWGSTFLTTLRYGHRRLRKECKNTIGSDTEVKNSVIANSTISPGSRVNNSSIFLSKLENSAKLTNSKMYNVVDNGIRKISMTDSVACTLNHRDSSNYHKYKPGEISGNFQLENSWITGLSLSQARKNDIDISLKDVRLVSFMPGYLFLGEKSSGELVGDPRFEYSQHHRNTIGYHRTQIDSSMNLDQFFQSIYGKILSADTRENFEAENWTNYCGRTFSKFDQKSFWEGKDAFSGN